MAAAALKAVLRQYFIKYRRLSIRLISFCSEAGGLSVPSACTCDSMFSIISGGAFTMSSFSISLISFKSSSSDR